VSKIEIIPLGGIGEFGMNCMGIRYADEMIVIDAGMGFPEETPYGVDISIPNFDFLEEYRDDLTAIILTHGHEDHIGALTYILKKFNLPVYASRFTIGLAEKRLEEHGMLGDVMIHRVKANDVFEDRRRRRAASVGRFDKRDRAWKDAFGNGCDTGFRGNIRRNRGTYICVNVFVVAASSADRL